MDTVDKYAAEAMSLYSVGLNVFPVPLGSKAPFGEFGFLFSTRLHQSDVAALCAGRNVAVMCGRLSRNLFVIDCDDPVTFGTIGREIRGRGLQPWIRNGKKGGGQFWFLAAEGEVSNASLAALRPPLKGEVRGNYCYSIAAPGIHPEGFDYQWIEQPGALPPLVTLAQVDFLKLSLESSNRNNTREKDGVLPKGANRVLVHRNVAGFDTHSGAEYAACASMVSAGFTDEDILQHFERWRPPHFAKVGAAKFRRHVLQKARLWIQGKDRDKSAEPATEATPLHSSLFTAWATGRPWTGRAGSYDRAVYLALCERMRRHGGTPFRASVREVAELASMSKQATSVSLERLTKAGLIASAGADPYTRAGLWTLTEVPATDQGNSETENECQTWDTTPYRGEVIPLVLSLSQDSSLFRHDAWRYGALGKSARECYERLVLHPATVGELAQATGRNPRTVYRALERLWGHALADTDGARWFALQTDRRELESIARQRGTAGRGAQQHALYAAERERFASERLWRQIRPYDRKALRQLRSSVED